MYLLQATAAVQLPSVHALQFRKFAARLKSIPGFNRIEASGKLHFAKDGLLSPARCLMMISLPAQMPVGKIAV